MESIGFKEWAVVCEALGQGRQSIILRKGGIAEGAAGFSFQHRAFFLFPTWFHEQPEKVRAHGLKIPAPPEAEIEIRYFARLEQARIITSWPMAEALAPLHILKPEVVRERFEYDEAPGIHLALVRVFRLATPWKLPNEKKFGGCRSWVPLPEPPVNFQLEPVLSDAEHERVRGEFENVYSGGLRSPHSFK
jgi:hypothetical protein